MVITSTANQKVKRLVTLRKKRRVRDQEQVFLVEGIRMFREIPKDRLLEVYVTPSFYEKEKQTVDLVRKQHRLGFEELSEEVFDYVSDTKTPQGVLCVVSQRSCELEKMVEQANPFLLVLDNLQDPGNLGTMLRTAEGAGVTGIIMSSDCVDIYNPKTIRSTMGSVFRIPFCHTEDVAETTRWLKGRGIRTYAAHLEGSAPYDREDYKRPCAFLIGNEGNGLGREAADSVDTRIRIPMEGEVESLNAATAAAILLFEAARQRRGE